MGHTHRCQLAFKKKNQVKNPSPESRTSNSVRIHKSGRTGNRGVTQQPSEHIPVTSKDLLDVMDAIRTCAATSPSLTASHTALAERMARADVTLEQNQSIILQIQSHLGLPPVTLTESIQPTTHDQSTVLASAASLDVLTVVAVAYDLPASTPPAQ